MIALHEDKFNCVPTICLRTAGTRLKDQRGQTERGCSAEVTRQSRHSLHSPCGDSSIRAGKSNSGSPEPTLKHKDMKKQMTIQLCAALETSLTAKQAKVNELPKILEDLTIEGLLTSW